MEVAIGSVIGGCRIEEKLGEGGMGIVYKAHHLALDIPVAVKFMRPTPGVPDAQERFLREARIAARLRHPNIVSVLNVGCEEDRHFIIMEYVNGENLQQRLSRKGKLPTEDALQIAVGVLQALNQAFGAKIVHRDIKPENILIEPSGVAKLADLGLARRMEDLNLTQSSTMLGSPYYVAPEQAQAPSSVDIRADIYSLGCTLFHMLSGTTPFPGTSVVEVITAHLNKPVPLLNAINPEISPQLSGMVARMMEKDPAKRFQTPREALDAVDDCMTELEEDLPQRVPYKAGDGSKNGKSFTLPFAGIAVLVAIMAMVFWKNKNPSSRFPVPAIQQDSATTARHQGITTIPTAVPPPVPAAGNTRPQLPAAPRQPGSAPQTETPAAPERTTQSQDGRFARTPSSPVFSAAQSGDIETLDNLLNSGASPNPPEGAPTTPLHKAVTGGDTRAAELLLSRGANPNLRDIHGDTPLHYALRENATFMAALLLKYGANPNMADHRGKTPLAIAASVDDGLADLVRRAGGN
jgi:serine/threonine protein kinase